jgi:hypothetical protein
LGFEEELREVVHCLLNVFSGDCNCLEWSWDLLLWRHRGVFVAREDYVGEALVLMVLKGFERLCRGRWSA